MKLAASLESISCSRFSTQSTIRRFGHMSPLVLFAAMLVTLASMPAAAETITWNLENVALTDGTPSDNASLAGTFTTDATTMQLTAYDINVMGGPYGCCGGYNFSNLIANYVTNDGPADYGVSNYGNGFIDWDFASSLAANTYSADISFAEFYCQACNGYLVTGVSGQAVQVTEPLSLSIFGAGLLGALAMRRRENTHSRPAY